MYEEILKRYKLAGADVDSLTPTLFELCQSRDAVSCMDKAYRKSRWHRPAFKKAHRLLLTGTSIDVAFNSDVGHFASEVNGHLSAKRNGVRKVTARMFPKGPMAAPTQVTIMSENGTWVADFNLMGERVAEAAYISPSARVIAVAGDESEYALVEDVIGLSTLFYCSGTRTIRQLLRWLRHQRRIYIGECGGIHLRATEMCQSLYPLDGFEALVGRLEKWADICPDTTALALLTEEMRHCAARCIKEDSLP